VADVYFDVDSFPDYGTLSAAVARPVAPLTEDAEAANPLAQKKTPVDFVL